MAEDKKQKRTARKATEKASEAKPVAFPVVGLGASAGGLQAFSDFLDAMPDESGMAFVLIHQVDPNHESLMAGLLAKHTNMPVALAVDGTEIAPDHVYVIPPNQFLAVEDGKLRLSAPEARRGLRLPINFFMRSLARNHGQSAVAIILSGTGSDGTAALAEVKDQGGIVLVQEPKEAAHDGMPRSAIAAGAVDHVLPVAEMPKVLLEYRNHPYINDEKTHRHLATARWMHSPRSSAFCARTPLSISRSTKKARSCGVSSGA